MSHHIDAHATAPSLKTSMPKAPETASNTRAAQWSRNTLLGIQGNHMPSNYQDIFLWDDIILFTPGTQVRPVPERQPEQQQSTPDDQSKLVCKACMVDWLLVVTGIIVLWAALVGWTKVKTQEIHGLSPWRSIVGNVLTAMITWAIINFLYIPIYHNTPARLPACPLAGHLARRHLPLVVHYMDFCWRDDQRYNAVRGLRYAGREWPILRIAPYPDLFTCPGFSWLNYMYLSYQTWLRRKVTMLVFTELEHDGKLSAEEGRLFLPTVRIQDLQDLDQVTTAIRTREAEYIPLHPR